MNVGAQPLTKRDMVTPKIERREDRESAVTERAIEDPLKNIAIDVSVDGDDDNQSNQTFDNGLDQTIIIGEMDEGNIFDDLKMSNEKEKETKQDEITISKADFKDFVDNLKLKHRAEVDAIMLEQTCYKRIIQQMIHKFK